LFRFNSEDYPARIGIQLDPANPSGATLTSGTDEICIGASAIWIWRPQWPTVDSSISDPLDVEFARQESVAAIGGLLRTLNNKCVSPADAMQAARWKVAQLAIARTVGMLVPESLVTSDPALAEAFAKRGPTVAKAVAEARVVLGEEERSGYVQALDNAVVWESIALTPVLFQRKIAKIADLRITIVGRHLFPVLITTPTGAPLDFRATPPRECVYNRPHIESALASACLAFLDQFGLRFGAFDFAVDSEGRPWFLECNPAGQWGWLEDYGGVRITAAVVDLLMSLRT